MHIFYQPTHLSYFHLPVSACHLLPLDVYKRQPEASLETLLVLDAITGQNAISQAKEFCKAADATGIIRCV